MSEIRDLANKSSFRNFPSFIAFDAHFPEKISKQLCDFANNVALKDSRYVVVQKKGKHKFGYCTHCHSEYQTPNWKHKETVKCPSCKSKCQVRSAGMGRKKMFDKAAFVWYEKSRVNPQAITARIIKVARDYSEEYRDVQTGFNCRDMYLFEPGKTRYFHLDWSGNWIEQSRVYSAFDRFLGGGGFYQAPWDKFLSISNIKRAVKGTPFQYSTWEEYTSYENPRYVSDMVEFFDLYAKYPCIEYLTKCGFRSIVEAKLYRMPTFGAINWRGKTIQKVLRLNKQELHELRTSGLQFKPSHLRYYQKQRTAGGKNSLAEAFILSELDDAYYSIKFLDILKIMTRHEAVQYMLKQLRKGKYERASSVLLDWLDYQNQCKTLGMRLSKHNYLFPNDLHEAHKKNTARIKLKNDKPLNDKLSKRLPDLEKYNFQHRGLFIRPATSTIELFEEGKALDNCLGDYSRRYANGECEILFIRKVNSPEKAFFAIQLEKNKVVQCRGYDNCEMTPEVRSFVNAFISKKLLTKKQTRIDMTGIQPANRMEVVV